jgi:hypothetical protein
MSAHRRPGGAALELVSHALHARLAGRFFQGRSQTAAGKSATFCNATFFLLFLCTAHKSFFAALKIEKG